MARFLIGTIPTVGHVNPALPIARELVKRNHEVWWYTGIGFQSKVEATGARHVPIRTGLDFSNMETIPESWLKTRESLKGLAQFKFYLKHCFIDSAIVQSKECTEILQEFPADVFLSDLFFLGASWIYEKGGPPWAAFGITGLPFNSRDTAPFGLGIQPDTSTLGHWRNRCLNWLYDRVLLNEVTLYLDQVRSSIGLMPEHKGFFEAALSPFLYLQGTVPGFEYPRSDLPSQVHFIGPFLPDPPDDFTPPTWWDDLKGDKPVIHVTQGTVGTEASNLIIPTIEALADEDVLVVATTGGQPVESIQIDPIPANVRLEKFIPHYYLLPHINVMVTNGGFNGVHTALANGIPLVTAGQTEEKPEICARVQWAGAGISLKTNAPTPTQLKRSVKEILAIPRYRQNAERLKADIASYDAPNLAATLLEHLAATKRPVDTK
ncbi:MAG: glycosyltransferase [Nostoc sp. DedSLP03]|uniref:nucleotide disphospho-sugar-binding domain-containing protein n=1 Tax=Nostoc sp. DedSLP03 TaxID=3075400 RepID=UPI002AD425D9|nr:nucleotide disphospho-sugar-binding domain-containing protein [Nostoc sp. DedSLP03]MDZ7970435.1 glycosyltransferase [Nostoc sp. DedSLP03]